jgi:Bacterial protein of unknown function (DUF937)
MTERPLKDEVLEELGEERLLRISTLLGADPVTARKVVGGTVASLTEHLTDDTAAPGVTGELCQAMALAAVESEPPPGTSTAGAGMIAAVLERVAGPASEAVADRTGLTETAVGSALEVVVPVTAAVLARRARS